MSEATPIFSERLDERYGTDNFYNFMVMFDPVQLMDANLYMVVSMVWMCKQY